MSKVYFDTGALVKLYIFEPGSDFVQRQAQKAKSIPFNQLQETELRNAIHAAIGRKSIPSVAGGGVWRRSVGDGRQTPVQTRQRSRITGSSCARIQGLFLG